MSGDLIYATGEHFNLFRRGSELELLTCNPAASSDFGISGLADDDPNPFAFGSVIADGYIELKNNRIENGDFETALGDEWEDVSSGTGSATRTASGGGRGGTGYGLRINGGAAGVGAVRQSINVQELEQAMLDAYFLTGASRTGSLRLQNRLTGKWWVNGAWQVAEADAVSVTNTVVYTRVAETLPTVEDFDTCQKAEMELWLYIRTADNGNVDVDDVMWSPEISGLLVYGHNIGPRLVPQLRSSTDAFIANDDLQATLTPYQPAFHCKLSVPIIRQYWRLKLVGTADDERPPEINEACLVKWRTLSKDQLSGWRVSRAPMTSRIGKPGTPYRTQLSVKQTWSLELSFLRDDTDAPISEFWLFDNLSKGGHWPIAIAPSILTGERFSIYGHIDPKTLSATRERPVWRTDSVTVNGMLLPLELA